MSEYRIIEGDCIEQMAAMNAESVDAVITDPPYNVGKNYGPDHDDRLEPDQFAGWMQDLLAAANRASRGPVVFFPGTKNLLSVPSFLPPDMRVVRVLGWHKREYAGDKWNGGPAMCWEPIVWASSEEKPTYQKLFGWRGRDFLVVNATHGDPWAKLHPCPKPLEVMAWLIGLFSPEDGTVLDPCAGTGTTGAAALRANRDFVGIELNPEYAQMARDRIRDDAPLLNVEAA